MCTWHNGAVDIGLTLTYRIDQGSRAAIGFELQAPMSMSLALVFSDADRAVFQARNPKRRRTAAWDRYERYKVATTVGQARALCATTADLRHDVEHGFAKITSGPAIGAPGIDAGAPLVAAEEVLAAGAPLHAEVLAEGAPGSPAPCISAEKAAPDCQSDRPSRLSMPSTVGYVDSDGPGPRDSPVPAEQQLQALQEELAKLRRTVSELRKELECLRKLRAQGEELPGIAAGSSAANVNMDMEVILESPAQEAPPGIAAGGSQQGAPRQEAPGSAAGSGAPLEATGSAGAFLEAPGSAAGAFLDLAVRAFEYGMGKYRLSKQQLIAKQATRKWLDWMAQHVPLDMVQNNPPRVLAALMLHAAWCMEWADGLPWSRFFVKLVRLTHEGGGGCQRLQMAFPFHVMRFLQLSAEDCKCLGFLHCKLLSLFPSSGKKGLPDL